MTVVQFAAGAGKKFSSLSPHPDWLWGSPNLLLDAYQGLSLGVKWLEHESDHSPPSSAEVKNAWSYTSTPPYVFMAWCLVKHGIYIKGMMLRDNFTFL
jgi:hypothetical protein